MPSQKLQISPQVSKRLELLWARGFLFSLFFFFFLIFFNVYSLWRDTEGQSTSGEGAERERERETRNPKQAPGSEPSAQSPTWGSNTQAVRS